MTNNTNNPFLFQTTEKWQTHVKLDKFYNHHLLTDTMIPKSHNRNPYLKRSCQKRVIKSLYYFLVLKLKGARIVFCIRLTINLVFGRSKPAKLTKYSLNVTTSLSKDIQ